MQPVARVTNLFLVLAALAACAHPRPDPAAIRARKLADLFATRDGQDPFNGVVLVAEKGEVTYRRAFGYRDRAGGVPMTADTAFEIGSVSKPFTAVAVLQLEERGKIRLDDKLTRFFPGLPYGSVSIRGLLSHTSGLFDVYGDEALRKEFYRFYGKTEPPYTNRDYLAFLEALEPKLIAWPGERCRYSNTGYVLLALIVEHVSGLRFDAYLRRNIFEPAGMRHTVVYSLLGDRSVPNLATGRVQDPEAGPRIQGLTYGDDEIVTTADDLLAFDRALRSGKLLRPETLRGALVPPVLKGGGVSDYALGFRVFEEEGRRYVSHAGSTAGFLAYMKFSTPGNDTTVILLTNGGSSRAAFQAIHRKIRAILRGTEHAN
jgi:CubicO group peptidase (beta-lactamase class C family)